MKRNFIKSIVGVIMIPNRNMRDQMTTLRLSVLKSIEHVPVCRPFVFSGLRWVCVRQHKVVHTLTGDVKCRSEELWY